MANAVMELRLKARVFCFLGTGEVGEQLGGWKQGGSRWGGGEGPFSQ